MHRLKEKMVKLIEQNRSAIKEQQKQCNDAEDPEDVMLSNQGLGAIMGVTTLAKAIIADLNGNPKPLDMLLSQTLG